MFRRLDILALSASAIAGAVTALYLYLVAMEGDRPSWWAVTMLLVGAALAAYAVRRTAPLRRTALVVSALALFGLGWLAVFTIGMPLLLAAGLCVLAAMLHERQKDWRDSV